MIRFGQAAIVFAASFIVLLAVRQWFRQRKADRQWAAAVAARHRAAEERLREAVHFAAWQAQFDEDRSEP